MKLISAAQAAADRGLSKGRICVLAATGRIKGARKVGTQWVLPENFIVTPDPRIGRKKSK